MLNNSDFTNLHVHTEFSLLDGAVKVKDLAKKAKELGFRSMAVTEHGSMDGIVKYTKACTENGIQPIYGCELYMLEHWDKKDDFTFKHRNLHLIAQAKNEKGLRAMLRGLGYANLQGTAKKGFASRAFLPLDYPLKNKDWHGNVVIQTGCASSPFWNAENGAELLRDYKDAFGEDLYAEVMPLDDFPEQLKINDLALTAAKEYGLKTVATNDLHFLCEDDHETHDVVLAIGQRGMTWDNPKRWKFDSHRNYLREAQDVYKSLRQMGMDKRTARASILNTQEIAEKCKYKIEKIAVELPRVLPEGINETKFLIQMCASELRRRGLDKENYWKRLDRELNAITTTGGFTRYMLMVADLINWAKGSGIEIGPGRGSVGGSLVSYLLKITEVDPIRFGLVFERFISEGRVDLPDIDIDVEDRKRHLIEGYLKEKYGEWNVAHVGTFGTMKGKQTIRDVSRVFEVPIKEAGEMSKCIISRTDMDARASFSIVDSVKMFEEAKRFEKKYPHVIQHAAKLEGMIKTVGVHAAGFVVSRRDLRETGNCYLVRRGKDKALTVNWDKDDLEHMGLMKLDVLGLSTLSVMSEAKALIKKRHGIELDYTTIPLDEVKVYDEIGKGNTVGAFQIGSKGLQKYCRSLKLSDFNTLVDASALWRPGPLKAGIAAKYLECKLGNAEPEYLNDIHKKITKRTRGQIIYQEQIMFLLHRMAGISWGTTDLVRKAISKSEGTDKWDTYKEMFAAGCVKNKTLGRKEAESMFDNLKFFAVYAFNLSHSVEYGVLSYLTMWLKVNYPVEFFTAHINCSNVHGRDAASDEVKLDIIIKEVKRMGLTILQPDINQSNSDWTIIEDKKIRAGLKEVKMCGETSRISIAEAREKCGGSFRSLKQFMDTVDRRKVNKRVVKMLIDSGSFDEVLGVEGAKVWKINYDELYESLGSDKKFTLVYDEKLKTLQDDWASREDDVAIAQCESLNFALEAGLFGRYAKLAKLVKENLDIDKIKSSSEASRGIRKNRIYVAQATSMKFKHSEKGSEGAMGSIYGYIDDGTAHAMVGYSPEIYKRKKERIENIKGESGVFYASSLNAGNRSKIDINDFVLFKDISRGRTGSLKLKIAGPIEATGEEIDNLKSEVRACEKCNLRKGCKGPVTPRIHQTSANILILGEVPSDEDDRKGEGFNGRVSQLLFDELKRAGIDRANVMTANTVACRPPGGKLPNVTYVTRCPWTTEVIKRLKPKFILSTGNSALYYFTRQAKGITERSGKTEWNNRAEAFITYCINPASVFYHQENLPVLRKACEEFARVIGRFA